VKKRTEAVIAGAVLVVAGALAYFFVSKWPFTQSAVERSLGKTFSGTAHVGSFQSQWFPQPGFVSGDVQIQGNNGTYSMKRLRVESSYPAMLRHSHDLNAIHVEGLAAHLSRSGGLTSIGEGKSTVEHLTVDRSSLVIDGSRPGDDPFEMGIDHADLRNVSPGRPMRFDMILQCMKPRGRLEVKGEYGPKASEAGRTPTKGHFRLVQADLGVFHGLGGVLTGEGNFEGPMEHIRVAGTTNVPDFKVADKSTSRRSRFRAVYGVRERHDRRHSVATGGIGDSPHAHPLGRRCRAAGGGGQGSPSRIPVGTGPRAGSALPGDQSTSSCDERTDLYRAHALVPPEEGEFLKRVQLDGDFGIQGAKFGNPKTQSNVTKLSERASGDKNDDVDPSSVISDLKGHVRMRGGVAYLSNVSFRLPGATASLAGTFNVITHVVNIQGKLAMEAELSQATSGVKSFFLKALDPFFKRRHAGAVIPVRITGTSSHPVFSSMGMHSGG
jgi:hypothetical protein